jgi:hypothetical protein
MPPPLRFDSGTCPVHQIQHTQRFSCSRVHRHLQCHDGHKFHTPRDHGTATDAHTQIRRFAVPAVRRWCCSMRSSEQSTGCSMKALLSRWGSLRTVRIALSRHRPGLLPIVSPRNSDNKLSAAQSVVSEAGGNRGRKCGESRGHARHAGFLLGAEPLLLEGLHGAGRRAREAQGPGQCGCEWCQHCDTVVAGLRHEAY